jgi:hypothetical protein
MYEHSFHPADGDKQSVQKVVDEAKQVLDLVGPGKVWFQELNLNCESQRAREQSRAIAQLPGVIGLPGPV